MCIFKDALEEGNLDKIKFRFDKVIYYIQELLKLININSYLVKPNIIVGSIANFQLD